MIAILFLLMMFFMFMGLEIYVSMGFASVIYLLAFTNTPLNLLPTTMVGGISNFSLLAIPFFMLAGELMNLSGITIRVIEFSKFFIGKWKGGLAYSCVIVNIFAAGVSGSGPADCSAVSSVLLPAMKKDGYRDDFAAAINASAAVVGPIIPPSIPMVFLALITNLSVGKLFLGGFIPGLIMGLSLMVILYFQMKKMDLPVMTFERTWGDFFKLFKESFFALLAPLVIIVGIVSGIVTITEVSILATAYVLFVGMFIYKTIKLKDLIKVFANTALFSSTIMALFSIVGIFSWIMSAERVAQSLAALITSLNLNPYVFLLLINIFFLFIGMIMDALPAMMIFMPVLLPIVDKLGIDPIHFGVVVVLNLMIGLLTPPVGALLYVVTKIGNVQFHALCKTVMPFVITLIVVLLMATYIPGLVTWLPNLLIGG